MKKYRVTKVEARERKIGLLIRKTITGGETMKRKRIKITDYDLERIEEVLRTVRLEGKSYLQLENELNNAEVLFSNDMPPNVVTMNSKVRVRDMDTDEEMDVQVVFPIEENLDQGKVSVLAPIGTALLGYQSGDIIEWKVPLGIKTLKIDQILYQPESAGDIYAV